MQAHDLKLNIKRKKRKTIGRGGKKGTYCGKGMNGQKARSGGNVDPLFEGGRSTLIDHMKKKRGFKSLNTTKPILISLDQIEKKFKDGEIISFDSLIKVKLIGEINRKDKIKILGDGNLTKKLSIDKDISFTASVKSAIEKAGGEVAQKEKAKEKKKKDKS
jgi:large subunit ribosomal protein L15